MGWLTSRKRLPVLLGAMGQWGKSAETFQENEMVVRGAVVDDNTLQSVVMWLPLKREVHALNLHIVHHVH
eukprot:5080185-Amphidinium_carterae.2